MGKIDNQKYQILIYYVFVIVSSIAIGWLALALDVKWLFFYVAVFTILHIEWAIFNLMSKFSMYSFFMPFYYIFMITYLFPIAMFFWQIQVYSVILLYVLLPLILIYHDYTSKYIIFASICSVFFIVLIIISSKIEFIKVNFNVNESIVYHFLRIIFIFIEIAFILIFIYFYTKVLKNKTEIDKETAQHTKNSAQLKELYNNVIAYFDKKQPYRKPNYVLSMLAAELNTNTKYLSDAINSNFGGSFESLLNKYRLNFAKKMLDENLAEKYTMEYIYTSAGYSNRSTFYENFRKTFQMTPLEYHKMKSA